jgi:hypothetical protein
VKVSNCSISIEGRKGLRAQQQALAQEVVAHSAAVGRRAATPAGFAEVIAVQDEMIVKAEKHVPVAATKVIDASGLERDSEIVSARAAPIIEPEASRDHSSFIDVPL